MMIIWGSGTIIQAAIKKYGKQNFTKTILEYFDTEKQMYLRESEIVDKNFVLREDTYNIALGGVGGWSKSNEVIAKKRLTDREWVEQKRKNMSLGIKKAILKGKCRCATKEFNLLRNQKSLTPESIEKRKQTYAKIRYQQGENHNLFGKIAVHKHDVMWIWIDKSQLNVYQSQGWIRGKGKK